MCVLICVVFSGTTAPEVCPKGSWSNSSGLRNQEDCKPCPGGSYCDSPGLTKPSGFCNEGYSSQDLLTKNSPQRSHNQPVFMLSCFSFRYYCSEGAVTSTPIDGITGGPCPEGHYCPEGTVQPLPCDPGTYVAVTHATRCELCVPGWYCVSGSLYLCPAGLWFVY